MNRHGVSNVIAALLLIAITVAAAVMTYAFSMGLLGTLQAGGGQQIRQQLILEAYDWSGCCPGNLKLWLRNVGPALIVVGDIFVGGLRASYNLGPCHGTIRIQDSCRAIVHTFQATIILGMEYPVKIVTVDGAIFSYSCKAGHRS